MIETTIGVGAIAGCYLAILCLYRWWSMEKTNMDKRMTAHETNADSHVDSHDLVYRDVCEERVKRFEAGQEALKNEMHQGFNRIEAAIKRRHDADD